MGTLSLTKEARIYNGKKDNLFNKWCWENWTGTCKGMKLKHYLTACTKINSKWIKGLNVWPDTLKLLEENIGKALFDIICRNIFSDISCRNIFPRVREIETQINKWGLIKVKSFCTAKKILNKMKRQHTV